MKILVKIIKGIIFVILLLIIIILIYKIFAKIVLKEQLPTIFGYGSATILSGSMQPNLDIGDYIIIKRESEYYENDIVAYIDEDNYMVSHRIIEKNEEYFITKGDNNNLADKPITKEQIKGKVVKVLQVVGMIQIMLSKPISIVILMSLMLIMLIIYFRKKGDKDEKNN